MFLRRSAKLPVAHHAAEDFVADFHAANNQVIQDAREEGRKIRLIVGTRRLDDLLLAFNCCSDLVKEKLVSFGEVSANRSSSLSTSVESGTSVSFSFTGRSLAPDRRQGRLQRSELHLGAIQQKKLNNVNRVYKINTPA